VTVLADHLVREGLRTQTSAAWASAALAEPLALLDDHAHLEQKAAQNALGLIHRWPAAEDGRTGGRSPEASLWARRLALVARDEIEHLGLVLRLLEARGGRLRRLHRNPYAADLHALVRVGAGPLELLDRLLVSALIEARSCERFERLASVVTDGELRRLYAGLTASERGHQRLFLELACLVVRPAEASPRWADLLAAEARILAAQSPGPRMHAGEPRVSA
jgi:tRNA-(ms[2]io[6]A)-hydroxylase